ncbi:MAG: adenylate/guanylate cyclase domain-containing protein [Erysipelotrichia bacterium]|nr:adenylate/guanylate cyclase domain-containing protein [Erysipelotrichia bacterium]
METSFKRSSTLKVEESGQVNIANENFLYIIKPLSSMFSQSFIPCLLTSTLPIEARLRDASIVVAALAFTALIGAVLLSLFLASSLLGPIRKIDFAAQQIGKGDLSVVLPDMGADELGRLSQTFNDMVKGLREREKMQAYVSDSVMEAIQGQADDSIHAGRNLEATILFSDIRNFTGMTEDNTPDKIFTMLNEFLGGVEPIIRNNNGRVDKFIGDAVMAVFHNTSPEHHALSAVKAGVQMKHFVKKLNQKRMQAGLFTINIGIGISTGTVLLGDVGSSRRKDLTVIGDEVNLASRLETASKKGRHSKIIFSGATYDIIRNYVEAEEMPFTEIRGKQQAISIYELIRLKKEITDEE